MAVLEILTYPDPFLRKVAVPVNDIDRQLKTMAEDMLETMYNKSGLGLAAIQVGLDKRMFVMDVEFNREDPESDKKPVVVINPEIVEKSGESQVEEGCLSVVDFRSEIKRSSKVTLQYQDLEGKTQTYEAEGIAAICIQHELDHLDGKLFIDYLPPIKRKMVKGKLKKAKLRKN